MNTEKLQDTMQEFASNVANKMRDLQIRQCGGLIYCERRTNVGWYRTLHYNESGDLTSEIGDHDNGYYAHGDFNHWVANPTIDEACEFLEASDEIRQQLAEVAEQKEKRVENVESIDTSI